MKTKIALFINVMLISFILISCKITYHNTYETYLENSPDESLAFKDSTISITFSPKPNGIWFDIENHAKNNLYLIWDKSYFIEPSGSSSKPLNTDILETNKEIREKENYESVIPQGGHFVRFTCPAKNLSLFSMYNTTSFYNETTNKITTTADYSKFYLTGNYWYLGSKRDCDSKDAIPNVDRAEIVSVQQFIQGNNNLGLGFTIRDKQKEIEYHFKFPIKNVKISKKTSQDVIYTLCYDLDKTNGFKPNKK
jgi:hypothetical protein